MTRAQERRRAREADRMDRRERKKRIAALRVALGEARKAHKKKRTQARAACVFGRVALRDLQKDERRKFKEHLKAERRAARENCKLALVAAKQLSGVERRRAELAAKRAEHARTKEIARIWKSPKGARSTGKERAEESDDAVRANIAPELVPVFNRVKGSIKSSARMSRTEAFLHYLHDNPEEAVAIQSEQAEQAAERLWRQLEKERDEARRPGRYRIGTSAPPF